MYLVSIIIPCYNRGSLLGATLDSIIQQSHKNWECIVVDDGSTDYTIELMEFYEKRESRIKFFKRPSTLPRGGNASRNYGFSLCSGDYVNWFDSDDLMHPEFIQKKLEMLLNSNGVCVLSSIVHFKIQNGKFLLLKETTVDIDNLIIDLISHRIAVPTHNPMWKRKLLEKVDLFDEKLLQSQDLDFHFRLFSQIKKVEVINEPLLLLRRGHESISNNFLLNTDVYLDSFLTVRKRIIQLSKKNNTICILIRKQLIDLLRLLLAKKNYYGCQKILKIIKYSCIQDGKYLYYLKLFIVYNSFKFIGRGNTRFRKIFFLF